MGRLDNKVALITGGARGMGASHVRRFVAEGAQVMITDLLEDEGQALASELGEAARFLLHDVTSEVDWQSVVDETVAAFGRIDILVNNAGLLLFSPIVDMSLADFRKVLDVNLVGEWLGLKTVGAVIAEGGSIVNISSVQGIKGARGLSAYTASKFGVTGITQVAAFEFGPRKVRVNSVHPGGVTTPMTGRTEDNTDASQEKSIMATLPLPRYATPTDVTNVVLFLASDESGYVTGAQYLVDGGMTAGFGY